MVEDNPNDEALTLRAFKKNKIINPIVVVRDGAEALDIFFSWVRMKNASRRQSLGNSARSKAAQNRWP